MVARAHESLTGERGVFLSRRYKGRAFYERLTRLHDEHDILRSVAPLIHESEFSSGDNPYHAAVRGNNPAAIDSYASRTILEKRHCPFTIVVTSATNTSSASSASISSQQTTPTLINAFDNTFNTPLSLAIRLHANECVAKLLTHDETDVNARDGIGNTPLITSIENRNTVAMKLILRRGDAIISARNSKNNTAEEIATRMNSYEAMDALSTLSAPRRRPIIAPHILALHRALEDSL
jgi:hypothetical protein